MAATRLFGKKIPPACKYCEHAMQLFDGDKVLCGKKGVVLADYHCKHFVYDPLRRDPKPPLPLPSFQSSDFSI